MSQKLLQVNLKFSISRAELEAAWLEAAQPIADSPGLRWKVWLMNEAEHEAGGIYLFDSEAAAQSYLAGPIVAALKSSPAVSNITSVEVKLFRIDHVPCTDGPHKRARAMEIPAPMTAVKNSSLNNLDPIRVDQSFMNGRIV